MQTLFFHFKHTPIAKKHTVNIFTVYVPPISAVCDFIRDCQGSSKAGSVRGCSSSFHLTFYTVVGRTVSGEKSLQCCNADNANDTEF